jgi:hypothetical protein
MPLDPRRVKAVFLEAADYHDPADREIVLQRACGQDGDLRGRVEALLKAHDRFVEFVNQPLTDSGVRARPWLA